MDFITSALQGLRDFSSERSTLKSTLQGIRRDIASAITQLQSSLSTTTDQAKLNYWRCAIERLSAADKEVETLLDPHELDNLTREILVEAHGRSRSDALGRASLLALSASPSIRLLALKSQHIRWDFSLTNPFRHAWWLPLKAYESTLDIWQDTKDLAQTAANVRKFIDPEATLEEISNSSILQSRQPIVLEARNNYKDQRWTSASVLLCTQTEGILLDVGKRIHGTSVSGHRLNIFDPNSDHKFITRNNASVKYDSIRKVLLESEYGDALPLEYLEYYASDFYNDRCTLAHGRVVDLRTRDDADVVICALRTTIWHLETLLGGILPHNARL